MSFFINYVSELESENNPVIPQMEKDDQNNKPINPFTDATNPDYTNDTKESATENNPGNYKMEMKN